MRQRHEMILFVHTPKCGGKSIRKALSEAYADRLQLHYVNPLKQRSLLKISPLLRPCWPDSVKTEIVYGHFCFDQFNFYKLFKSARKGMLFRNPLDLVCSRYFYLCEKHSSKYRNVTIVDFAKFPENRYLFKLFLGHTQVETLDFIGLHEHFNASLDLYGKIFGKTLMVHYLNRTQNKPVDYRQYLESEGLLERMSRIMEHNIIIYNQAVMRFQHLLASRGMILQLSDSVDV